MRDAGVGIYLTRGNKAGFCVKTKRVNLRTQRHDAVAAFTRQLQQRLQECRPHSAAARLLQHGHATDHAVGQQAPAANGLTIGVARQHMPTLRIDKVIPFQRRRHLLFFDKDPRAQRTQRVLVEGVSQRNALEVYGRTDNNRVVNFAGAASLSGSFVNVTITAASAHTLRGELASAAS
jgi:hypothetical protein